MKYSFFFIYQTTETALLYQILTTLQTMRDQFQCTFIAGQDSARKQQVASRINMRSGRMSKMMHFSIRKRLTKEKFTRIDILNCLEILIMMLINRFLYYQNH